MDALTMLAQAGERTQKIVEQVSAGQLSGSTPCTDWDVHTLLNHLIGGNVMFATLAAGGTLPDMSGGLPDFVGDDPAASYRGTFAQAMDAWRGVDQESTVALPFGPTRRRSRSAST